MSSENRPANGSDKQPIRELEVGEEFNPFEGLEELPRLYPEDETILSTFKFGKSKIHFGAVVEGDVEYVEEAIQPFGMDERIIRGQDVRLMMTTDVFTAYSLTQLSKHLVEFEIAHRKFYMAFTMDVSEYNLSHEDAVSLFGVNLVDKVTDEEKSEGYIYKASFFDGRLKTLDQLKEAMKIGNTSEKPVLLPYNIDMLKTIKAKIVLLESILA